MKGNWKQTKTWSSNKNFFFLVYSSRSTMFGSVEQTSEIHGEEFHISMYVSTRWSPKKKKKKYRQTLDFPLCQATTFPKSPTYVLYLIQILYTILKLDCTFESYKYSNSGKQTGTKIENAVCHYTSHSSFGYYC